MSELEGAVSITKRKAAGKKNKRKKRKANNRSSTGRDGTAETRAVGRTRRPRNATRPERANERTTAAAEPSVAPAAEEPTVAADTATGASRAEAGNASGTTSDAATGAAGAEAGNASGNSETQAKKSTKRIQAILNANNRQKIERMLTTTISKHSTLFKAEDNWPKIFTFFVAINQIIPNASGTEARDANKTRKLNQAIVLPLAQHTGAQNIYNAHVLANKISKQDSGYANTGPELVKMLTQYDPSCTSVSARDLLSLRREKRKLATENTELKGGNSQAVKDLKREGKRLRKENTDLLAENTTLKEQVLELQAKLKRAEKNNS